MQGVGARVRVSAFAAVAALGLSGAADAATLSYAGNLHFDDDVALIRFVVTEPSNATIRTFSYAGGTQANGTVIPAGGFDPIVTLFDGNGDFIDYVDDGLPGTVPTDPATGEAFDAVLTASLSPGAYFAAISVSDNNFFGDPGDNIAEGFDWEGVHDFTNVFGCSGPAGQFCDHTGDPRDGYYAFDVQLSPVPVPPALPLLGSALTVLAVLKRRRVV